MSYKRRHTNSCPHWEARKNAAPGYDGCVIDNCGNCRHYSFPTGVCGYFTGRRKQEAGIPHASKFAGFLAVTL